MALLLVCAAGAHAAPVAPRTAVLGADDVAGLAVGSASAAPWLGLVSRHAATGSRAATSVLRSAGNPRLLIVSRALVARDAAHAKALKQALGAAGRTAANRVDARALGVPASTLRNAQRTVWRDGPVVGELVTVGAAKGDALLASLQETVRARVRRTALQTPWDSLLARVAARGGRPDAATALKAFSLAVAPLPGVRAPKGPRGSIPEGTLATSWVLANYGRLTPRARQAVDRVLRRAFGLSGGAGAAGAQLDAVKAQAIAFVGQRAGVELTLPVTIVRGYPSSARGAAALGVDASGSYRSTKPAARCIISVRRGGASKTVIAHEVFHCLQIQITGSASGLQSLDGDRAWLGEGSASYAGCLFSQDGAAPYRTAYAGYLEQPLTPLGRRTYDAVGFFAHLDQSGAGALGTVRKAIASPSMAGAYPATANEGGSDIFGSWASSLYRTPARGAAWDVSGPCAPPRSRAAEPTPIVLAGTGSVTLTAPAYAAHPYEISIGHSSAGAISVRVANGHVRVGAIGVDAVSTGTSVYCLGSASAAANPAIAVSGGEKGAKVVITRTANTVCGPAGGATCNTALCLPVNATTQGAGITPPNPLPPPLGPHVNRIAEENAKPGTDPSIWDFGPPGNTPGAGSDDIQGFTTDISYNVGQTVHFKIRTIATRYRLDIYRLGYYQGNGARRVDRIEMTGPSNAGAGCMLNGYPGLVDCDNWNESATWTIPSDAVSGIYFAHLVGEAGTSGESHVVFVVRDDNSTSDIYYQTSDTTWQAYNNFGGESLYSGGPLADPSRAAAVSYNRPFATRNVDGGQDWIFNAEVPMVRWLERNGYDVSYETGVDTDRYGSLIKNHKLFMSTGHDEYWSGQQRANVESARDAGVNLAFFSGNEVFWKTRWDNNHRTLVSYKETHAPTADIDPSPEWTGSWRDPRTTQSGVLPENRLTGQYFTVNAGTSAITVPGTYRNQPFWRHTDVANLSTGGSLTLAPGTLGYEWDSDSEAGLPAPARQPAGRFVQPAGLTELSETDSAGIGGLATIEDYGHLYAGAANVTHHLTLYRAPSGALVFGAGTVQWSWGLDSYHDRQPDPGEDRNMQQATVNLFSDMGAKPTSLQSGLQPG
ncbi:MAG TPA: N,N-dimethylformamidase beta subunit family domain-containing protein [Baekduia sp.]|nr:N,N-dimethylformamidase beta subunit family domain-containing protein [Baekduia sp.]